MELTLPRVCRYTAQIKELVNGLAEVQAGSQCSTPKGANRRIPRSPSDSDLIRLGCRRTPVSTTWRRSTSCINGEPPQGPRESEHRRNSATFTPSTPREMAFIPSQGPASLMTGARDPAPTSGAPGTQKHTMQRVLQRKDSCGGPSGGLKSQTGRECATRAGEQAWTSTLGEATPRQRPPVAPSPPTLQSRPLGTLEVLPGKDTVPATRTHVPQTVSGAARTMERLQEGSEGVSLAQLMRTPFQSVLDELEDLRHCHDPARPQSEPNCHATTQQSHNAGGESMGEYVRMVKSWSYGVHQPHRIGAFEEESPKQLIGEMNVGPSYVYPIGEVDISTSRWGTHKRNAPVEGIGTSFPHSQSFPGLSSLEWSGTYNVQNPGPNSRPDGPLWRRAPAFVEPFLNG